MNLASLSRFAGILLLALLVGACSKTGPSETTRSAIDDTPAEHALKHTDPQYRCPMHPQVVRDEPGECPICGMALVKVEPRAVAPDAAAPEGAGKPLYYRNPMDPSQRSPVPAKDSMGMDYVPVYAEQAGSEVRISPAVINNLGVRTEAVVRGPLARRGVVVGYVQFDERRVQQVRTRAEGWVEGLAVRAMGETVRKGELLFALYSPMLESAQQEYLDALRIGNADLIAASRDRLRALGLAGTAAGLEKSGRTTGRVPFYAPISGVVTNSRRARARC
ncbi:MAG: efflux RND transporter periplasmic adaptor subunit [Steroidobacteraceae bacterium]